MEQAQILTPVIAMLALVFAVWICLFATRLKAMSVLKISTSAMNTPDTVDELMPDYARFPGHNFKNLFEVPVLFYVMCFYLYTTGSVDSFAVNCAWAFVGFRLVHSIIHCSYNNVDHRFGAYFLSCIALWTMLVSALLALV